MENEKIFSAIAGLNEAYKQYYNESSQNKFDLQNFSLWLYNSEMSKKIKNSPKDYKVEDVEGNNLHGSIDDQISFIFLSLHKLIKFYVKKATDGTKLIGIDDVHFLLYLAHTDSVKKSELINSHIAEMSSGIEVIKRLLKNELIEDFDDPHDKRSKRVKITPKGLEEMQKITSKFINIHKLMTAPLTEEEKFPLLASLIKVYNFHFSIFNNEKNTPLNEIIEKNVSLIESE